MISRISGSVKGCARVCARYYQRGDIMCYQLKSIMMTLDADARFRPCPPALVLTRKMRMLSFLLNSSTRSWRLFWGVWPSSRRYSNLDDEDDDDDDDDDDEDALAAPPALYLWVMKDSTMSSMEVHCEKINTFSFCHIVSR